MKSPLSVLLLLTGLLASVLLATPAVSVAQTPTKTVHFGLKVGANFSQLNDLAIKAPRLSADGLPVMSGGQVVYDFFQQNDSRTTGIVGGVFARFGNCVFIQPELLVSAKGGNFAIIRQGLETQSVNVRMTTVDLPVLVGVTLGPLRLNAGPIASLKVAESGSLKETVQQYSSQSISQTAKQAQLGYQAGIGLTLGGVQLDLRREGPLADVLSSTPKTTATLDSRPLNRASLWQLTVGFGF